MLQLTQENLVLQTGIFVLEFPTKYSTCIRTFQLLNKLKKMPERFPYIDRSMWTTGVTNVYDFRGNVWSLGKTLSIYIKIVSSACKHGKYVLSAETSVHSDVIVLYKAITWSLKLLMKYFISGSNIRRWIVANLWKQDQFRIYLACCDIYILYIVSYLNVYENSVKIYNK